MEKNGIQLELVCLQHLQSKKNKHELKTKQTWTKNKTNMNRLIYTRGQLFAIGNFFKPSSNVANGIAKW